VLVRDPSLSLLIIVSRQNPTILTWMTITAQSTHKSPRTSQYCSNDTADENRRWILPPEKTRRRRLVRRRLMRRPEIYDMGPSAGPDTHGVSYLRMSHYHRIRPKWSVSQLLTKSP
jgi:hypothetical protein